MKLTGNKRPFFYSVNLIAGLLVQISLAQAWEADVHYGLTRWLAKQAGFSNQQAGWIADGDQGVDDSPVTDPVHSTIASACRSISDKVGSGVVHDYHFPSKNGVPDLPKERNVEPGLVHADGNVKPVPRLSDKPSTFESLGIFLHALQDSWSHQGVPDFPTPPCDDRLGWGHAFARGGWSCHLADLTYRWHDDALGTAKATYEAMVAQSTGSPKPWSDLTAAIAEFIAAQSKWEKDRWFRDQGFGSEELGFLQEISLPDCADGNKCAGPYPFQQLLVRWENRNRASRIAPQSIALPQILPPALRELPQDIGRVLVDFVTGLAAGATSSARAVKTDAVDTVLSRMALARALHISDACPNLLDELEAVQTSPDGVSQGWAAYQPIELCEAAFQASLAGSGVISCEAAKAALRSMRIRHYGPDIRELAPQAQAQGLPLFVFENAVAVDRSSESYSTFVRFIHLPREVLMLTARRVSGAAKIVGAVWFPDQ